CQRTLQRCALRRNQAAIVTGLTDQIRRRQWPRQRRRVEAERAPRGPRCTDHEVVAFDREPRVDGALAWRRQQYSRIGKRPAKILGLDRARSVGDRGGDQAGKSVGQVGAAGGDIERRGKLAMLV
ncbi:hypothetical protein NQ293_25265, partial [Escherichia coli]|nr:hypothetical protein [Escherichia coli]